MSKFKVAERWIGDAHPTYFIADIAANHDGSLSRARDLIRLAAESGADAVKFQHFKADKIVSDEGFRALGDQVSHQAKWGKSVFEVYRDAELQSEWNCSLKKEAAEAGVHFFSSPYDIDSVADLRELGVPAYKMGSGDITWLEIVGAMAETKLPLFAATGASELSDVLRLMTFLKSKNVPVCLMQCNTNYMGTLENIRHVNLNVLRTYAVMFPDVVLGLSDHTPGHVTVLGAVAIGARAIEKHFTDDNSRSGPDHAFSMNSQSWREMIDRTRELEAALGSPVKRVAENERETVILQRRCLRAKRDLPLGHVIRADDLEALRPAPLDGFEPWESFVLVGKTMMQPLKRGGHFRRDDVR